MGFHLVERVYRDVHGTSSTAQAILAYLAHRADDKGVRKCYPSGETIEKATHFKHSAIHDALNELREANLLVWKSGGRQKGSKGMSLANEYDFNFPVDKSITVDKSDKSSIRQTDSAVSAKRIVQYPPNGNCSIRQTDTINNNQIDNQPSVNGETEAVSDDLKRRYIDLGEGWTPKKATDAEERTELRERGLNAVVSEAMEAVGATDMENRKVFCSTIARRNLDDCQEVILRFKSERNAGEHTKLKNPAGLLNKLLSHLPTN